MLYNFSKLKLIKFCMNYNQIKNYSINYYLRYYPSKNRLEEKLKDKFDLNESDLQKIMSDLEFILVEEDVIKAKVNTLINRGKNISYIKNNLLQKKFCKDSVLSYLEEISEWTSVLLYDNVLQKVQSYFDKNKSKQYVYSKLKERPEDVWLVEECIREVYEESEVQLILHIYYGNEAKYNLKEPKAKQKFIASLLSKWFKYGDIKLVLDELESN